MLPSGPARRIAALAALALAGWAGAAAAQPSAHPPPPSEMTQVALPDGRQMGYLCAGDGRVTVVFDTGLGLPLWSWNAVEAGLKRYARVCAYDRAGYPGSTFGPMPRDAEH